MRAQSCWKTSSEGSEEEKNNPFSSADLPLLPADAVLLSGPGMFNLVL